MRQRDLLMACVIALFAPAVASAGQEPANGAKGRPDDKASHRGILDRVVGHWDFQGKVYGEDSADKPGELTGWIELRLLLDSPWLVTSSKGRVDGRPVETASLICYDSKKDVYMWSVASSEDPPVMGILKGRYDRAAKTLRWEADGEPGQKTGGTAELRIEHKFPDDDTFMEIGYLRRPGSEKLSKWYELTAKRRKP